MPARLAATAAVPSAKRAALARSAIANRQNTAMSMNSTRCSTHHGQGCMSNAYCVTSATPTATVERPAATRNR
jgi:hypothetical protein